jgi:ribosome recycling factor
VGGEGDHEVTYATVDHLKAVIPPGDLALLTDWDGVVDEADDARLLSALEDATAVVNGWIAKRVRLPLADPPQMLKVVTRDLALHRLYANAGGIIPEAVKGLHDGASASMLEPVMVDAYGSPTPINQVGTVNVPESRMVTINVWDKALVGKVEKAIRESGLGINPQLNGTIIMLPIPELNEERRTQLTKVAAQYAEHARVAIRNVRRDGMDQIKKAKAKGMSEDDQKLWEGEVQELTDAHIAKVDAALEAKQGEIMQV